MKRSSHRNIITILLGLAIVLMALGMLIKVPVLVIKPQHSDQITLVIPMFQEPNFYTSFLHSVQKTPVREYYTLAPENGFLLTAAEYSSYGAGLPFLESDGHYEVRDHQFVITEMNRSVEQINLIYFDFIDYQLHYQNKNIDFAEYFSPSGESIAIVRSEKPLWQAILYS